MEESYDVIIIGAGPAGASAAKVLVENGFKTLIVEQKKLPRFKCCCGFLNDSSMDFIERYYGELPRKICNSQEQIGVKVSKRGKNFLTLEGLSFKNVVRHELDYWLVKESGAEVADGATVKKFHNSGSRVELTIYIDGKEHLLKTKYLIAADGADSFIRKKVDKNFSRATISVTAQKVFQAKKSGIDPGYCHVIYNKKYSDISDRGGYSWFLQKDDLLYIGTTWQERKDDYLDKLIKFMQANYELDKVEPLRNEGCYINFTFDRERLFFGRDNILTAGEATGIISPFGEGISSALISGRKAGEAIVKGGDVLEEYRSLVSEEVEVVSERWRAG